MKQLENVDANNTDKHSMTVLSAEVQATMSLNDVKALNSYKEPARACVVDKEGYIACGPIVGTPRPEVPPFKPYFPVPDEIKPLWPDKGGKNPYGIIDKNSLENK